MSIIIKHKYIYTCVKTPNFSLLLEEPCTAVRNYTQTHNGPYKLKLLDYYEYKYLT